MIDVLPYYFFSIMLLIIYAVCTLVNLWCLLVMLVLVYDAWFLDATIRLFNKGNAQRRRKKFKVIKGDKKNVD